MVPNLLWFLIVLNANFHFKIEFLEYKHGQPSSGTDCKHGFQEICVQNNVIFRKTSFFSFPRVKEKEIELLKKISICIHVENHVYSRPRARFHPIVWKKNLKFQNLMYHSHQSQFPHFCISTFLRFYGVNLYEKKILKFSFSIHTSVAF